MIHLDDSRRRDLDLCNIDPIEISRRMGRPSKVELCLKIVEIALKDSFSASPPSSSFHTPAPGKSRYVCN